MASNPVYKIQISKYFGSAIVDEAIATQFAQSIMDKIIERTKSGIDKNGRPFKRYSKNYIKSLAFKAFNKDAGEVNLTLSGAMLGTMDVLSATSREIEIGWTDDLENAKANNHITGDTVPKRDFLGLPDKEIQKIADQYKADIIQAQAEQQTSQFTERALAFLEFVRGQG